MSPAVPLDLPLLSPMEANWVDPGDPSESGTKVEAKNCPGNTLETIKSILDHPPSKMILVSIPESKSSLSNDLAKATRVALIHLVLVVDS